MINPLLKNKLLVIDDELGPRESLRMLLKNTCAVTCAPSANEGLKRFREMNPDLVILDIRMPDLDGIETLRRIREMDANVAVIILTGYASVETAQEAVRLWACDYLKKPFDAREMLEVVERNFKKTAVARRRSKALSDFKDLNRRLMHALVRKDQKASVGEKAAEISHDLQTSLSVAITSTRLLFKKLNATQTLESHLLQDAVSTLDVIEESVRHSSELANVLQGLDRRPPDSLSPIPIGLVLTECVDAARPVAATAWLSVEFEMADAECRIVADPVQIFHVVHQVILNAIQLTAGTGHTLRVIAFPKGSEVEIRVIANGCTLDDESLARLLDPTLTTSGPGEEWTFSIARKLLEKHGGSLAGSRTATQDLLLVIRLPLFQETKAAPSEPATADCRPTVSA